jgi:hypothetical protein
MTDIVIVNASHVLQDKEITDILHGMQAWDRLLQAAYGMDAGHYSFATMAQFQAGKTTGAWPIFINNHSSEAGALGWHDASPGGVPFGRVFAGDCKRYGVSWTVDMTHEAAEMRLNPQINKFFRLADGRVAPMEACDAVEDDTLAIVIGNLALSDFVLPTYWTKGQPIRPGTYDYRGKLRGPCPALTPGGYQSLYFDGQWHQVTAMHLGGPASFRSTRFHNSPRRWQLADVPEASMEDAP